MNTFEFLYEKNIMESCLYEDIFFFRNEEHTKLRRYRYPHLCSYTCNIKNISLTCEEKAEIIKGLIIYDYINDYSCYIKYYDILLSFIKEERKRTHKKNKEHRKCNE